MRNTLTAHSGIEAIISVTVIAAAVDCTNATTHINTTTSAVVLKNAISVIDQGCVVGCIRSEMN